MKKIDKIFQYRSFIGIPVMLFLIYLSNFTLHSFIIGITFIIAGIMIRIFAGGGVYSHFRKNEFRNEIFLEKNLFSITRHPLYFGNFLIITGLTIVANWKIYIVLPVIITIFWIIYGMFIYREELLLKQRFGGRYIHYKSRVPIFPLYPFRLKKSKIEIRIGKEWDTIWISTTVLLILFIKGLIWKKMF